MKAIAAVKLASALGFCALAFVAMIGTAHAGVPFTDGIFTNNLISPNGGLVYATIADKKVEKFLSTTQVDKVLPNIVTLPNAWFIPIEISNSLSDTVRVYNDGWWPWKITDTVERLAVATDATIVGNLNTMFG